MRRAAILRAVLHDRAPLMVLALGILIGVAGMSWWTRLTSAGLGRRDAPTAADSPLTPDPGAAELLRKVAAKLDACSEIEVSVTSRHQAGTGGKDDLIETASAKTSFQRADSKWRITGKTAPVYPWDPESGRKYELLSDHNQTTVWVEGFYGDKPVQYADLETGLESLGGITRGSANHLAEMLLHRPYLPPKWDPSRARFLEHLAQRAQPAPDEDVDGHPCFCVSSRSDWETWVFWIDKETLLPRKSKETQDAKQRRKREPPFGGSFSFMGADHRIEFSVAR
jgi:hypothetical protein